MSSENIYDVITVGTATRDVFLTSPFFRVISDKKHFIKNGFPTGEAQCFALGGKIEIAEPILTTGGGAANAAVAFSRQGLKTAALIKIGRDESAKNILDELNKENVSVLTVEDPKKGTAFSTVLLAPGGERTILVYRGASENLKIKEIPFQKLKARWAYIVPGKISLPVMGKIFNHFHKNGTLIAFNPSKHFIEIGMKRLKPFLAKSKALILNREEASILTGVNYQKENEIFKKLDEIAPGIVAMTDGPNGVLVSDGRRVCRAGVFKEKDRKIASSL